MNILALEKLKKRKTSFIDYVKKKLVFPFSFTRQNNLHANQSRQRMTRGYLLVLVDANIDEENEEHQNILTQLRNVVKYKH